MALAMDAESQLERARAAYASRAWSDAYEGLAAADKDLALAADDLELLARSAYMLGLRRGLRRRARAGTQRSSGRGRRPARRSLRLLGGPQHAVPGAARRRRSAGSRAATGCSSRRSLDCAERGYLLIPVVLEHTSRGEFEDAHATAAETAEIGERFGDPDLAAIGVMEQGHALVRLGRAEEGLRLVDETMAAVSAGQLSPIVAGIVYCNTIAFCRDVYEVRRAREWTAALTRWCEEQPEMVAHNGLCLVHRAELMTIGGAWTAALEELRQVGERFRRGVLNQRALGHAAYREGEVHRLQGEFREAETFYKESSPLRPRAATGARSAPPGPGQGRDGGRSHSPSPGRDGSAAPAGGIAPRLR